MTDSLQIDRAAGLTQDELVVGNWLDTTSRTITEADLVNYVTSTGLFESLFVDARERTVADSGRLVPGMLTLSFAEGLLIQRQVLQDTGIALLGMTMRLVHPVRVGDTVTVRMTVTSSRASRMPGRGVVTTSNVVRNQDGVIVLEYEPTRLIKRRS